MKHFSFRLALSVSALALYPLTACLAAAQTAASASAPAASSTAAGTIRLPVTIVDDHGNPVRNLTAADLTLTDNGHAQTIQSFSLDPSSSIVFGLIAQASASQRSELGDARLATVKFLDHTLPGTDDKAFLIQYDREVDLLEDPTSVSNKLHDAINQIGSPQFGSQNGNSGDSGGQGTSRSNGPGGTLYDAIYLASVEVMKNQPGRRMLILITDGIDHGSKETENDAIEAAQNAHTAVFAIYYKGEEPPENNPSRDTGHRGGIGFPGGGGGYPGGYPGGGGGYPGGGGSGRRAPQQRQNVDGRPVLEHICNETGGYMIEGRRDKADEAYEKLVALLKNQHTISYIPSKDAIDSSYHRISLTAKKKGVYPLVQEGYTSAP